MRSDREREDAEDRLTGWREKGSTEGGGRNGELGGNRSEIR